MNYILSKSTMCPNCTRKSWDCAPACRSMQAGQHIPGAEKYLNFIKIVLRRK